MTGRQFWWYAWAVVHFAWAGWMMSAVPLPVVVRWVLALVLWCDANFALQATNRTPQERDRERVERAIARREI